MSRQRKTIVTAMLCLVLTLMTCTAAFAESHHVNVTFADGSIQVLANTNPILIHEERESIAARIEVATAGATNIYSHEDLPAQGTLPGGTGYQVYASATGSGARGIFFKYTTALNDTIDIRVTGHPASYTVIANSGVFGQGDNRGGSATCKMSVDTMTTVPDAAGKYGYLAVFTPLPGQEIAKLNIRANFTDDASAKLVNADAGTVNVDGQTLSVLAGPDGSVTVSASAIIRNLFITALTKDATAKATLSVATEAGIRSSVEGSKVLEQGSTASLTLTPDDGLGVGDIVIESESASGTIRPEDNSAMIGGKIYSVKRSVNGTVTLSVPAMTSDVKITVRAVTGYHFITVSSGANASSKQEGLHYVPDGAELAIRFLPGKDAEIEGIRIQTEAGIYRADRGDRRIYISNTSLRLASLDADELILYLDYVDRNMTITPETRRTAHSVSVSCDAGATSDAGASTKINDGDDFSVQFTPNPHLTITALRIRYGGVLYTADARRDTNIRINGIAHPIRVDTLGRVSITLLGVTEDVSIAATSDIAKAGPYIITKKADSHSKISSSGGTSLGYGKPTTVTVTPSKGYELDTVLFETNTDSAIVFRYTDSFVLDGRQYAVKRNADGSIGVYFDALYQNLSVESTTRSLADANADYHKSYVSGYGNGLFGPENHMTRAEAVQMLCNLYAGDVRGMMGSAYRDVELSAWYQPAIQYAYSKGYLSVMDGGDRYFRPNQDISRAELLTLLFEFSQKPLTRSKGLAVFSDTAPAHWANDYIVNAYLMGLAKGYPDGGFHPDSSITRAEVVTLVNRFLDRSADTRRGYAVNFSDVPTNHWAYFDIMEAANSHTVTGTSGKNELWQR